MGIAGGYIVEGEIDGGKRMITTRNSLAMPWLLLAAILFALSFTAPSSAQKVQVDLSSTSSLCGGQECFNLAGLYTTGTTFLGTFGMDNGNNCTPTPPYTNCPDAYSSTQLGLSSATPPTLTPASLNVPFTFGAVNTANCGPATSTACTQDVVNLTTSGVVITLPTDQQSIYSTLIMLGTAVNGHHTGQVTATYTDGTTNVFSQTFSDWCGFGGNQYESVAVGGINRINSDGTLNGANCNLYAYTYPLDFTRTLQSITLTDEDWLGQQCLRLAITLKPPTYTINGGRGQARLDHCRQHEHRNRNRVTRSPVTSARSRSTPAAPASRLQSRSSSVRSHGTKLQPEPDLGDCYNRRDFAADCDA